MPCMHPGTMTTAHTRKRSRTGMCAIKIHDKLFFQKQTITNAKMAYRDDKTAEILRKKSQLAVIKQPISPLKHA